MPDNRIRQYLLYSQLALYATFAVCIAISPASLTANAGFSYFGHHRWTVAPFELGLFTSAYFLLQAERLLRAHKQFKVLHHSLVIIIPAMIGVGIAPALGSGLLDLLHRIFGTITFVTELILAGWLIYRVRHDFISWLLYAAQWGGGIVAFIYLSPPTGYSIEGQLIFQLGFSGVLLRSLLFKN